MPAKDLGAKHVCYKCGTKFYDLRKPAPICPKCGADQRASPAQKAPPPQAEKRRPRTAEPEAEEAGVEADLEAELEEPGEDESVEQPDDDE